MWLHVLSDLGGIIVIALLLCGTILCASVYVQKKECLTIFYASYAIIVSRGGSSYIVIFGSNEVLAI